MLISSCVIIRLSLSFSSNFVFVFKFMHILCILYILCIFIAVQLCDCQVAALGRQCWWLILTTWFNFTPLHWLLCERTCYRFGKKNCATYENSHNYLPKQHILYFLGGKHKADTRFYLLAPKSIINIIAVVNPHNHAAWVKAVHCWLSICWYFEWVWQISDGKIKIILWWGPCLGLGKSCALPANRCQTVDE